MGLSHPRPHAHAEKGRSLSLRRQVRIRLERIRIRTIRTMLGMTDLVREERLSDTGFQLNVNPWYPRAATSSHFCAYCGTPPI